MDRGNISSNLGTSESTGTFPSGPLAAILLCGKTGSGKSSLIKLLGGRDLSGNEPTVDGGLDSCTKKPTVYMAVVGNRKIVLLDTPGFDDSGVENIEILNDIVGSLYTFALRKEEIKTQGVIFLHDISETRFAGSQKKTLEILRTLCGPEGMRNCIIGTTMWNSPGSSKYRREEAREGEFQQRHWQGILKTTRIPEDDVAAVTGIINAILACPPILLLVQREMLRPPHTLENTTVGKIAIPEGRAEAERLRREFEDYQRQAREEAEAQEAEYRRQREEDRAQFEAEQARLREEAREREERHRKREEEQERLHQEKIRQMYEENQKREEERERLYREKTRQMDEENQKRQEERERSYQEKTRQMNEESRKREEERERLHREKTRQMDEESRKREEERERLYQENTRKIYEESRNREEAKAARAREKKKQKREAEDAERAERREHMEQLRREFTEREERSRREFENEQRRREREAEREAERERERTRRIHEEFEKTRTEPKPKGFWGKVASAIGSFFGL